MRSPRRVALRAPVAVVLTMAVVLPVVLTMAVVLPVAGCVP